MYTMQPNKANVLCILPNVRVYNSLLVKKAHAAAISLLFLFYSRFSLQGDVI